MAFERLIAGSMLTAVALLATRLASADDTPVEKPAVDKPALHQESPGSSARGAGQPDTHRFQQSGSAQAGTTTQAGSARAGSATQTGGGDGRRSFLYLAPGLGVLSGLSGGADFERTNPALTALLGVEIPLGRATGLGIELDGDLELAGEADRGTYTSLLLRARLGQMLTQRHRVWGAAGIGGAGYQTGSFAFGIAAGTSLMLAPKFGLDLSANLNLLGAASNVNSAGVRNDYDGGAVFLLALRALFEFHR